MAEALYRKYRPQTFDDVVGQTHIERTLKNAIEQDKVSHAYLFCGPRGTGKTTTARLLAKALLCEGGPTPSPDGTCEQCEAIAHGNHPDVYELDAASRTGVDNVRDEIISRVQYAPTRGRYKVYIIDEVHMLSTPAFNALLKTLEEPPSHVVFILCTTDPQKVPETIHSRCQRFDFHRLSNEEIILRLGAVCGKEGVQFEGDALDLVAHRAQGGMRDALTILEQLIAFGDGEVTMDVANDVLGKLDVDEMSDIVRFIASRDAASCFTWVSEYVETGADLAQFTRDLASYIRDLYVLTLTDGAVAVNAPQSALARMSGEARAFGVDRLAYILRVLGDLGTELRTSTNARLSFEIALTRMVRPQSDLTLESLAARVEVLERAMAQGVTAAPAAAAASASAPAAQPAAPAMVPAMSTGYKAQAAASVSAPVSRPAPTPAAPAAAPAATESPEAAKARRAQEFRAQLESRRAQREQAQPQPVAPQAAPAAAVATQQTAAAAASAGTASADVKEKISNPAALQRGWQATIAALKQQRAAYGALMLSARLLAEPDASGVVVEFSRENAFAYAAAQKPDIMGALKTAFEASFGGPVPFRVTQGDGSILPHAAAPAASAPAPVAAPAPAPAAQSASAPAAAPAPVYAPPSAPVPQAPPFDDVVPYDDSDAATYAAQAEERPPFPEPDATLSPVAQSHQEASAPVAIETEDASASDATAAESAPAPAPEEVLLEDDPMMQVMGPQPVDPYPLAVELGFTSMPDPKKKVKGRSKPTGWPGIGKPKPRVAKTEDAAAASASVQPAQAAPTQTQAQRATQVQPASQPAPASQSEPAPAPAVQAKPAPAQPPVSDYATAIDAEPEMTIDEIFASFGVPANKVIHEP